MRKWISAIFYSFPVQLFLLHFRNNLLLVVVWFALGLLFTGNLAHMLGIRFLFLSPEYLGVVNIWSFFILGFAFGGFFMTWNLTTYLLDAYHFPFLASLSRPFTKFILNNFLLPLIFVIIYFWYTISFQSYFEYRSTWEVLSNCLGFILGFAAMVMASALYFYLTNKDILSFLSIQQDSSSNEKPESGDRRDRRILRIKEGTPGIRVDTYLTLGLQPRLVRSVAHYDAKILLRVFKQNHVNALIAQLFGLITLVILGFLIDRPAFLIPAGASVFILGSVISSVVGAITYWFDQWRLIVFVLLLVLFNFITRFEKFNHTNKAYGLDYWGAKPAYSYETLEQLTRDDLLEADKAHTLKILNTWKAKLQAKGESKPKMVLLGVSGGGLRSSVWSMQVISKVDSILHGELFTHTTLITGASGGLLGTAYMRELYLYKQSNQSIDLYDDKYKDNISKDLLNSVAFTIVSNDLFLPWRKFQVNEHIYRKDRGYVFERQLNENTGFVFDHPLSFYKKYEIDAEIPMLFVTPSIVNDGRRLIISPQPVSYMMVSPLAKKHRDVLEVDAVDFGRLFADQGADQMRFVTALRMNATYPYILPNVYLPSQPSIEVMDAGFRDNYGVLSATRFIHVFKDWIKENTGGVTLMLISAADQGQEIEQTPRQGAIETLFNPLEIAGRIMKLQDYEHDNTIGFVYDLLGEDYFNVIRFVYYPSGEEEKAAMTFHLTQREKDDVLKSFYLPENQESLNRVREIFTKGHEEDSNNNLK